MDPEFILYLFYFLINFLLTLYLHIVWCLLTLQYSPLVPTVDGVVGEVVGLIDTAVVSGVNVLEVNGGDTVDGSGSCVPLTQSPSSQE